MRVTSPSRHLLRRTAVAATAAALLAGCGAPDSGPAESSGGTVPDKPSKAVTLNILDVAGNLQLTQGMIDESVMQNPEVVSRVTTSKAT